MVAFGGGLGLVLGSCGADTCRTVVYVRQLLTGQDVAVRLLVGTVSQASARPTSCYLLCLFGAGRSYHVYCPSPVGFAQRGRGLLRMSLTRAYVPSRRSSSAMQQDRASCVSVHGVVL